MVPKGNKKEKNETDGTWEHMSSTESQILEKIEFNLSIIQPPKKKKKKEKKNLCMKYQKKKKRKRKITTKPRLDEGRPGFEGIQGNKEKKIRKVKEKKKKINSLIVRLMRSLKRGFNKKTPTQFDHFSILPS